MKEKIIEIIAEELEVDTDSVRDGDDLYDTLEMDSMTMLAVAMSIEKEFDIRFQKSELATIHTIGDIEKLITEKKNA